MSRKPAMLNVRKHLEHAKVIEEGLDHYGLCPAIEHELKVFFAVNNSILRKHYTDRKAGNRKDIPL